MLKKMKKKKIKKIKKRKIQIKKKIINKIMINQRMKKKLPNLKKYIVKFVLKNICKYQKKMKEIAVLFFNLK